MTQVNNPQIITEKITLNGKTMELEYGRFAQQANAAVIGRLGDTIALATVVCGPEREDLDYFPLQVEYQEKLYAGGKIKGSRWVKREGRPSDEAVLTARLIDRSIRPLFPEGFTKEVQVVVTVLSVDGENDADILSLCTVSAALSISDIPFEGPVAAVRVGDKDGNLIVNPTYAERNSSHLDLVVSSTADALVMVEAGANEVDEQNMVKALEYGSQINGEIVAGINSLVKKAGKKKMAFVAKETNHELRASLQKKYAKELAAMMQKKVDERQNREQMGDLIDRAVADHPDESKKAIGALLFDIVKEKLREQILTKSIRSDGRHPDEIRPLAVEVGLLARTHGSAMFMRGVTQALSTVTLGAPSLGQQIESMEGEESKRYMHHYFFPPYSVGECGRIGWPSRREVGHGALAERALEPMIPAEEVFPYAIRVVSEIMSSNGSTSMASVCGSTMSLMDAGVPIKKPVAGIAMGLVSKKLKAQSSKLKTDQKDYVILTDISGQEDHIGDMDFKVAGTKDGITALQMDIKLKGVSKDLLDEALAAAKKARLFILDKMLSVLPQPRQTLSPFAPQIAVIQIDTEKIGEVIGPGGRMIRKIIAETETEVDVDDDGKVTITGQKKEKVAQAIEWIEGLTREVQAGEVFENAPVTRIMEFGAFVEILPGKEGLVHVSRMGRGFVKHPNDVVKVGDKVKVHVTEIDDMKRVNLSMLFDDQGKPVIMPKPERRMDSRRPFHRDRGMRPSRPGGFRPRNPSFVREDLRRPRY